MRAWTWRGVIVFLLAFWGSVIWGGGSMTKAYYKLTDASGVPMEEALDPDQCEQMRLFLHTLIRCSDMGKVNVSKVIKAYRKGFVTERMAGAI